MTATNLGLNGEPVRFLGAYVKNVNTSLGQSVNASTASITLVDDPDKGILFEEPELGHYYELEVGNNFRFAGIITRFDKDIRNISGRQINVSMSDVRDILKNVPTILSPGSQDIVNHYENSECSLIDVFGAYTVGDSLFNLSGWNQSGMPYKRIAMALNGGGVLIGTNPFVVGRAVIKAFGERYRIDMTEVTDVVNPEYRINTNLTPISNIIEDLANRHAFDWYVESEIASDGIIDITIRIISRVLDNFDIGLPEFLSTHDGRVVACNSGVELRNELSCMALQGAPVEQMRKVDILGMANEPLDLSAESGSNAYLMSETEMRTVLHGRQSWEVWLLFPVANGGGGGYGRYGGSAQDDFIQSIVPTDEALADFFGTSSNLGKGVGRSSAYLDRLSANRANVSQVFEKLKGHAEATYGRRWVHNDIGDEIIDSCWTRDVVAGDNDPYEYFRQEDGRTRAFVEYSVDSAGGAFSLGLSSLTSIFGDAADFRYVTKYGSTFENVLPGDSSDNGSVIVLDLAEDFNPGSVVTSLEKTDYCWNDTTDGTPASKVTLYVAATIDKDGIVKIDSPVFEKNLEDNNDNKQKLLAYTKITYDTIIKNSYEDADGNAMSYNDYMLFVMNQKYGNNLFGTIAKSYQPRYVYIPTRSRVARYGPVFSSHLHGQPVGKLEILQDDGFCPWEFGGVSLMLEAMQLKVDNASSYQTEAFSATVTIEGFPQYNLGDAIERNSNISNISITFGVDGGVKTTYNFQSFARKFGELTNEDWARLAYFASTGAARVLPQRQSNFLSQHNVRVAKNTAGKGSSGATNGAISFG